MNKLQLVALCLLFFFACQQKKVTLSIDESQMIEILKDLHIAEEMAQRFRSGERDSIRVDYLQDISDIYQLDTSLLFDNLAILKSDPDLAYRLYTEVYTQLENEHKELSDGKVDEVPDKIK